jgi:hypothetical protein
MVEVEHQQEPAGVEKLLSRPRAALPGGMQEGGLPFSPPGRTILVGRAIFFKGVNRRHKVQQGPGTNGTNNLALQRST